MDISLFKNRLDWILCAEKITNVGLLGADSKTNVKGISELLSDCFACLGTQVKDWPNTQICKTDKHYFVIFIRFVRNIYESFSDVGEIRVYFASKILTPCRMH